MKVVGVIQNFIIIASGIIKTAITKNVIKTSGHRGILYLSLMFGLISMGSCNMMGKRATDETPTRGNIRISVDESFQPIIESELFTFTHLYPSAKITPQFKPEMEVIDDFMNDSVKVIVTSKKLTDYQIQFLRDTQIIARTTTYAYDALAFVTNPDNKDTLLKYNTIQDIFKGKIKTWSDINQKSKLGNIRLIFDNNKSGNVRYFKELFGIDSLGNNFFAVNDNKEVIDFVSRNKDALGIVSVNWISDKDDSTTMSFINKINTVAVSHQFIDDGSYYPPQQGFIYDKSYPFVREVYLISRETFSGLGSGFINWACAEQGQRVVLKSGLVPATMPIRLVQVRK